MSSSPRLARAGRLLAGALMFSGIPVFALDLPPISPPPGMFRAHRERLLAKMPPGSVMVLRSAPDKRLPGNVEHEYRQNSDFWWITGFGEPDSVAVLRKDAGDGKAFTIFVRRREPVRESYDGARPSPQEAAAAVGADTGHVVEEVWTRLFSAEGSGPGGGLLGGASSIHLSDGGDAEFATRLRAAASGLRTDSKPAPPVVEAREILHELRLVKDDEEIALLRRAAELSGRAHLRAMRAASPGMWEFEIQAALDGYCLSQGARRMAYPSIVGSGPNALVLHYAASARQTRDGELVLNDSGCEYALYACDITRTYPVNGKFTEAQRAVYDVALTAQKAAIAAVRPGVPRAEVEKAAARAQVEGLLRLGLLQGDPEQLLQSNAHRRFTLHGVSHWVGLDVHDPGRPVVDGKPRPLEPGMVFTIEPGIYVVPAADVDPKWHGIGVRIEDVVAVTKEGADCLTCFVPKEVEDLEKTVGAKEPAVRPAGSPSAAREP